MELDREEHKAMLLQLINQAQVPGHMLEAACDLKRAIKEATVKTPASEKSAST